ncbi:hypothetical protein FQR65_LT20583 [Abscondita terminalis]|nr:hypothetical protein FQR65_LT20583 [Abscondita terminalis]
MLGFQPGVPLAGPLCPAHARRAGRDRLLFVSAASPVCRYEDNDVTVRSNAFMQNTSEVQSCPASSPCRSAAEQSLFSCATGYIEVTHRTSSSAPVRPHGNLRADGPATRKIKGVCAPHHSPARDTTLIDDEFRHDIRNTSLFISCSKSSQGIPATCGG